METADFITDAGGPVILIDAAGEELNIGRYGVWLDGEVISTSDDLDHLRESYGDIPLTQLQKRGS